MLDKLKIFYHYLRAKRIRFRSREELLSYQMERMQEYERNHLIKAQYYNKYLKSGNQLPKVNKDTMMSNFDGFNTLGISSAIAMPIAIKSEEDRNFSPMIGDVTVGLSSGTSAKRGLFLVTKKERLKWAGIILAKCLPHSIFKKTKIAFFLRANSNLYTTLKSSRIQFEFFDLFKDFNSHIDALKDFNPDVLVAPAQVLKHIALKVSYGLLQINPKKIISCAEVLTNEDKEFIEKTFTLPVHEIYQATEGFLATTCKEGNMHLNEEYIHIEKEWIDKEKGRFIPIISDFSRTSQIIWKYRLDDVLVANDELCKCGNATQVISRIEGRCGDVLTFADKDENITNVFPDTVVRLITLISDKIEDYRLIQIGGNSVKLILKGSIEDIGELERKFSSLISGLVGLEVDVQIDVLKEFEFDPSVKVRKIQNQYKLEVKQ